MSTHSHAGRPTPPPAVIPLLLRATRAPWVISSLVPALAGGLVALGTPHPRWWLLAVALLALALLHGATNASNDVEDFARGVDPPDKERNTGVFTGGEMTVAAGRRLYGGLFAATVALGALICAFQGPALIVIGVIGVFGGLLYTAGPSPYKYLGLGEPLIVLLMGPLLTQGTYTAVTGDAFSARAFWIGLVPGLVIAGVLSANNLSDLETDRAAGVSTLAVRLGYARARCLYLAMLASATAAPVILWLTGLWDAWILLPLLSAPLVAACAREVRAVPGPGDARLDALTARTGQLQLLVSLLLCVAVILGRG